METPDTASDDGSRSTLSQQDIDSILRSITQGNSSRLTKLLGRHKAQKNVDRHHLSYSLLEAVSQGKDDCVPSLLAAGADPNCEDEDGKTALYLGIERGGASPTTLKELLRAGAKPNVSTYFQQMTPLHVAARKGYQVAVKALTSAKAKIDQRDVNGSTPLMYAAKEGHVTIVRTLIRDGADPDAKNLQEEAAIHMVAKYGHIHVLDELLAACVNVNDRDSRGHTPLFIACKNSHIEVIEALLEYHCDLNAQDANNGKTILHWAIQNSNAYLVDLLLRQGASTNVRDSNWETPFMTALNAGNEDIIKMLMASGCDVRVTDRSFNTALHIAAKDGRRDIIAPLIKAGLDANLKGAAGLTPLMLAALGGYPDIVFTLLRHGARPDMGDRYRATALMYAILSKTKPKVMEEMIVTLIRASCKLDQSANVFNLTKSLSIDLGSDVHVEDRLYSPLEMAYLRGLNKVFLMLIKAGCDVNNFYCDQIHGSGNNYRYAALDSSSSWFLLKCLHGAQKQPKSLKEICRRSVLQSLGAKAQDKLTKLPVSDKLKRYLNYTDLEYVEDAYDMNELNGGSGSHGSGSQIPSPFSRDDRRRKTASSSYRFQSQRQEPQKQSMPSPSWADRERNTNIYGTFRRKKHERRATAPEQPKAEPEPKSPNPVSFLTPQPSRAHPPASPNLGTSRLKSPTSPAPGRYINPIPEGIVAPSKKEFFHSPLSPKSTRRTPSNFHSGIRSPTSPKPSQRKLLSPKVTPKHSVPSPPSSNSSSGDAPLSPRLELKRFAGTLSLNDIGDRRGGRPPQTKVNGHVPNSLELKSPPPRRSQRTPPQAHEASPHRRHQHSNNAHGHSYGQSHFHGMPDTVFVAHESETPTSLSPEPDITSSPFRRSYQTPNYATSPTDDVGTPRLQRHNSGSTSSEEPSKSRSRIPVPVTTARTSLKLSKGTRRTGIPHPARGASSAIYSDPGSQTPTTFRRTWSFKV